MPEERSKADAGKAEEQADGQRLFGALVAKAVKIN